MKSFFFFLLGFYSLVNASTSSYLIENIAFPDDMPPEIGGLAFDKKGNLYACLRRGDVLVTKPEKDPSSTEWKVFATGLHNPMGMELIGPGHIVVTQMAEFTEIIDTDQDGVADRFNNLTSDFGISGNYHETNAICTDGEGGFYIALGTASHNGPTFFTLGANTPRRAGAAEIFHPMTYADGLSVITKTANSPLSQVVSVCTMESPVLLTVKFGAATTKVIGVVVPPFIMYDQGLSMGIHRASYGTQTSMVSVLLSSSQERCWMIFTTNPLYNSTVPP